MSPAETLWQAIGTWLAHTTRTTLLYESAMYILPAESTATLVGFASCAPVAVANDPSPAYPAIPLPTTVLIMPVLGLSWRIRLLTVSEMSTLPEESSITSDGPKRNAFVAGPPSPA